MPQTVLYEGRYVEICDAASAYVKERLAVGMTVSSMSVEAKLREFDRARLQELESRKWNQISDLNVQLRSRKNEPWAVREPLIKALQEARQAHKRINDQMNYITDVCVLLSLWITTESSSSAPAMDAPPPLCTSKIQPDSLSTQKPATPLLPHTSESSDSDSGESLESEESLGSLVNEVYSDDPDFIPRRHSQ